MASGQLGASPIPNIPQDIIDIWIHSKKWFDILRRLRSCARSGKNYSVITMHILVDPDGRPVNWPIDRKELEGSEIAFSDWIRTICK